MPCRSFDEIDIVNQNNTIDKLTRMLCEVLTKTEPLYNGKFNNDLLSEEIKSWWIKHKEEDKRRIEYDKKLAEDTKNKELTELKRLQQKYKSGDNK